MKNILPVSRAVSLPEKPLERRWLVEQLWSDEAVGIIGGEPKCGKSILALSLAVAVASGTLCFGKFKVPNPGRVLLFAAEDPLHVVKARLHAIAEAEGLELRSLDILVITRPAIRLDIQADYELLKNTVEKFTPKLLLLDPFVRLHRIDENQAGDVAPILSQLRYLQRTYKCSVALVHHARKDSKRSRAGQALRGSSEFHAWGDSNLYLQRNGDNSLVLTIEHRAESSHPKITLQTLANGYGPYHQILQLPASPPLTKATPSEKIIQLLGTSQLPLPLSAIRNTTKLRTQVVSSTLNGLIAEDKISHSSSGYSLAK